MPTSVIILMVFMSDVGGICQGYGGNGTELIPHKVEQQHTVSRSVVHIGLADQNVHILKHSFVQV